MAVRKGYSQIVGKRMYVPHIILTKLNVIGINYHLKGSKAFEKLAELGDIGLEVEKTGMTPMFMPLDKLFEPIIRKRK